MEKLDFNFSWLAAQTANLIVVTLFVVGTAGYVLIQRRRNEPVHTRWLILGCIVFLLISLVVVAAGDLTVMVTLLGGFIAVLVSLGLPILVITLGVYFGLSLLRPRPKLSRAEETPLDILKARYASGEIPKQQFEEMKKDLM